MVTILLKLATGAVIALEIDRRLQQLRGHSESSPEQDRSRGEARRASDNATGEIGHGPWQLGRGEAGKTSSDADSDKSDNSSGLRSLQERGRYW
jgi:hypothetical protein